MSLKVKLRSATFACVPQAASAAWDFTGNSVTANVNAKPAATRIGPLFPIVDFDAFGVSAFIHAPADIAAAADHNDTDVVEIRNGRVSRKFQPRGVRLHSGAGRPQLIVDDLLVKPIVVLGNSDVVLHPLDQLFLGVEAEAEQGRRDGGVYQQQ